MNRYVVDLDCDNIKRLSEFFMSGAIVLDVPKDRRPSLFPEMNFTHQIVRFLPKNDDIRTAAQRGLSWVGKQRFCGFGIRGDNKYFEGETPLLKKSKKYPKSLKHRKGVEVYGVNISDLNWVHDSDLESKLLMDEWKQNGHFPERIAYIFMDPSEDQEKLTVMLGKQTYRHKRNKYFREETKAYMGKIYKRNSDMIKRAKEKRTDFGMGASVSDIGSMIGLVATFVDESAEYWFWKKPAKYEKYKKGLWEAVEAMAKAGHEIRKSYPQMGWEVRDGIVHSNDYVKLLRLTSEKYGAGLDKVAILIFAGLGAEFYFEFEKEDIELVSKLSSSLEDCGFSRSDIYYSDYFGKYSTYNHEEKINVRLFDIKTPDRDICWGDNISFWCAYPKYSPIPRPRVSLEDYKKIAELRIKDFHSLVKPYCREERLVSGLLRMSLNKERFRDEVNRWLNNHGIGGIDWVKLNEELEARYVCRFKDDLVYF